MNVVNDMNVEEASNAVANAVAKTVDGSLNGVTLEVSLDSGVISDAMIAAFAVGGIGGMIYNVYNAVGKQPLMGRGNGLTQSIVLTLPSVVTGGLACAIAVGMWPWTLLCGVSALGYRIFKKDDEPRSSTEELFCCSDPRYPSVSTTAPACLRR
jgi:hypothetical protein